MEQNFTDYEIDNIAAALYDGGWRAEDRDWIMEEYGFTEEIADLIYNTLRDFAMWEAWEAKKLDELKE